MGLKTSFDRYKRLAERAAPPSPLGRDLAAAFCVGGGVCLFGEALGALYTRLGAGADLSATLCSLSLIFLSALFTGLGLYDAFGAFAGAGSLVPITGFANAMTSCAMEFRREGLVTGLGAKMFTITGPVLVYGLAAGALYGLVLKLAEALS